MDKSQLAKMIDHAVLKPDATTEELERECKIAVKYGIATICVKPSEVKDAKKLLGESGVGVCVVVGFPHGGTTTAVKVLETEEAILNGAEEVDMVINIGKLISGDINYVKKDIMEVVKVSNKYGKIVKVIIECALLNYEQKVIASRLVEEAGAKYVKTSTGFANGGAKLSDIEIIKNSIDEKTLIKASGGIKTYEDALEFVNAGCSRLGTSSISNILD